LGLSPAAALAAFLLAAAAFFTAAAAPTIAADQGRPDVALATS